MTKRDFILCAPLHLIEHSNGVVAIAQLALSLEKAGYNAFVCVSWRTDAQDAVCGVDVDTYVPTDDGLREFVEKIRRARDKYGLKLLKDFSQQYIDECYVVYPEVTLNNPLNAKRVVRYFLNKDGIMTGQTVNVGPNDFILAHSRTMHPSPHFVCFFCATHPLFHDEGTRPARERTLDLLYIGKGAALGFNGTVPNTVTITRTWPPTKDQLALLLRNCRIFYTADACTCLSLEALLCGAVLAFVHKGPWTDGEIDASELGVVPRLNHAASSDEVDFEAFEVQRGRYVDNLRTFQSSWDSQVSELAHRVEAHFSAQ